MADLLEIAVGGIIAIIFVTALRRAPFERVQRFWALALVVAAAIYVGFAVVGGAPARWLLIEGGGVVLFAALAFLGFRYSPWVLAGAWIAHTGWDNMLHGASTAFVPLWYPAVCIGFDLGAAGHLMVAYSRSRRALTET